MKKSFALLFALIFSTILQGGIIQETIEVAAKVSGRMLSSSSRKAAEKILIKAVRTYGDDALKVVKHGGLEALKQGAKHGDDFWKLARHATPGAARSLALHADDLMPIAKRLGSSFMQLEGKVPGLAAKVVSEFGDDAARHLAAQASPNDISKLLGYASKADSPATKRLLLESYKKSGNSFLKKLDSKTILAVGLTASMITASYKVSDGIQNGIEKVAVSNPETFKEVVNDFAFPFKWLGVLLIVLFILPVLNVWKRLFPKGKPSPKDKDVCMNTAQN